MKGNRNLSNISHLNSIKTCIVYTTSLKPNFRRISAFKCYGCIINVAAASLLSHINYWGWMEL